MNSVFSPKVKIFLFYLSLFVFCAIACFDNPILDVDLWSRLIMGHNIYTTGAVAYKDIVSYTPTHTWYDHEWLLSFIFFVFVKQFNIAGIFFLKALFSFLSIAFIDLVTVVKENKFFYKYKSLYLLILLALLVHIVFFSTLRCQNITFVFLPILIIILEKYRQNSASKLIYLIPILMLIWLNCHGGSMYGVGIMGLYIIGMLLNRQSCKKLILILIPTLLVYFINPWGVDFVKFMFEAISVDRAIIQEWNSPFSMDITYVISFSIIQLLILITYIYSIIATKSKYKDIDKVKLLVFIATFILSLKYIKFSLLYFIIVFIFFYDSFKVVCDDIFGIIKPYIKKTFSFNWIIFPVCIAYFAFIFINYPIYTYYIHTIAGQPVFPLQFLKDNNIKGKIFAPFYHGGLIAYKCYPDLKIYMDGRQEQVYDPDIFKKQMDFLYYNKKDAYKVLVEYPADVIILENTSGASIFMDNYQKTYKKVYNDKQYDIYLSPKVQRKEYSYPQKLTDFDIRNILKSDYFN